MVTITSPSFHSFPQLDPTDNLDSIFSLCLSVFFVPGVIPPGFFSCFIHSRLAAIQDHCLRDFLWLFFRHSFHLSSALDPLLPSSVSVFLSEILYVQLRNPVPRLMKFLILLTNLYSFSCSWLLKIK